MKKQNLDFVKKLIFYSFLGKRYNFWCPNKRQRSHRMEQRAPLRLSPQCRSQKNNNPSSRRPPRSRPKTHLDV